MKTLDEIKEAIRKGLSPEEGLKALTDYVETHPGDERKPSRHAGCSIGAWATVLRPSTTISRP